MVVPTARVHGYSVVVQMIVILRMEIWKGYPWHICFYPEILHRDSRLRHACCETETLDARFGRGTLKLRCASWQRRQKCAGYQVMGASLRATLARVVFGCYPTRHCTGRDATLPVTPGIETPDLACAHCGVGCIHHT